MGRDRTTDGRRGRRVARLALAAALLPAALLPAALAPAAAGAQRPVPAPRPPSVPTPPAPPVPSSDAALRALAAELADLQRRREAAARRLERFAGTLRTREATPLVHDSLLLLVREHAELGTRTTMVAARLNLRQAERETYRRAREAAWQEGPARPPVTRTQVEARQARAMAVTPAPPEGWFGVNVEQWPSATYSGAHVLTVAEYPRVLSVEPGSPASRAGMQAGDRLVAIAGIDLRENTVDLTRLLEPGRTLPVRIARDGRLENVRVVVAAKPRTFVSGVTVRVTTEGDAAEARAADRAADRAATPRAGAVRPRVQVRERPPAPPVPVRAASPAMTAPSPLTLFYRSPNVALLAGAEVVHLPPSLRAGVEERDGRTLRAGVLVVQVARGSLADRAGLRAGDVLVRANGRTLTSPEVLHRVASRAADGDASRVALEVLRDRRARTITLRW